MNRSIFHLLSFLLAVWLISGCDSKPKPSTPGTVASLVPAATDLILAMGAGDKLVAVSNYDAAEVASRKLPRVGDYQTTDWETLAALRPSVMIIEMDPSRLPAGFGANAASLGIKLVNVRINSLQDIINAAKRIGDEIGEGPRGVEVAQRIAARLDAVRLRAGGKRSVRTLLTLDDRAEHLVGAGEFLNDALEAASGVNVAAGLHGSYPSADLEMVSGMKPDVVIVLKPGGDDAMLNRAKQFWSTLDGPTPRVYLLSDPWVLLPGAHIADVAEAFDKCLHPEQRP